MKKITNLIAILISLLPLAWLGIMWNSLPPTVPVHFGTDMKPDRIGPKSELLLVACIVAVVSVLVYFLLKNIHRFDPKRKGTPPSSAFQKLGMGMIVFMAALNFLIILSAKEATSFQKLLLPLLGLMFAFIGNYMNTIKPNYFAGIRLPWTLNNDENWKRTHQLGGKIWFAGGILIAVVSLLLPADTAIIFFIAVMVIMVIIPVVYSYRLFKKQSQLQ